MFMNSDNTISNADSIADEAETHALAFIQTITGSAKTEVCLRTFDDSATRNAKHFARKFDGQLKPLVGELRELNAKGAGVFMVINAGGQNKDEITAIRGVFADTDGAELDPLLCLQPHMVVQSSPGKWHAYWLVDAAFPLEMFKAVQLAIAAKFGTDPVVNDLSRVMRVPGFNHCKDDPFPVRIIKRTKALPRYSFQQIVDGLGLKLDNSLASQTTGIPHDNSLICAVEYPPSSADVVAEQCAQIGEFEATGCADKPEPVWRACIGVVKHCTDGFTICHDWSGKYSGYSERETQGKIDGWTAGPATCDKFKELNPSGCEGCAHTCTSPIQLGVEPCVDGPVAVHPVVARFNTKHFVAPAGSSVYVYVEANGKSPQPMPKAAFFDLYANDYFSADDKQQNSAVYWFKHKHRRQFLGGVTFDPSMKAGADKYNLFSGYAVAPKSADCEPILSHIKQVICAGNAEHAEFVLNWLAQMFQRPEVQPVTALVFQSGEGTGKTILTDMLQSILGRYWYKASSTAALVTQFNQFLQDCILVVGEEAVWGGDAGKAGILRDLITTKQLRIEIKNGPTYSAESFLHFIFLANDQWAVPAGHDARRWAVFRVSECKKGDSAYFAKLASWASDKDNQAAFLQHLLSRDLSKFNSRHAPMTEGLLQQKLLSLCDIGQFLYHSLMRGSLSDHQMEWPETVVCSDFVEGIAKTVANKHDIKRIETRAGILLKEIFQEGLRKGRETKNGSRRYVWHFPPLDTARAAFSRWMSQPIAWDAE
jgi:hypothetical protein